MIANNVIRLLSSLKIPFETFDLPAKKMSAIDTAQIWGIPQKQVCKTIVLKRKKSDKSILVLIPSNCEVDLRAVAALLKEKKIYLASQHEAEQLTELLTGGISPLALHNRGFQTIIDHHALKHEKINISAGQRGLNIRILVESLITLTKSSLAEISRSRGKKNRHPVSP